jgi:hypothetical protein
MEKYLIKTNVQELRGVQIAKYVQEEYQTEELNSIPEAILAVGLSAVGYVAKKNIWIQVASALGAFLSVKGLTTIVKSSIEESDLEYVIDRMHEGQTLRVITKIYQIDLAGGNHSTWTSEVEYEIL